MSFPTKRKERTMRNVTLNVPDCFCNALEKLLTLGVYPSRSEAIRVALKQFIDKEIEISALFNP